MISLDRGFDPLGLPEGQFASPGSDLDGIRHAYPQLAQLLDEHPLHEDPADLDNISPLFPLLRNPQADMMRETFLLRQEGQPSGPSFPMPRYSNFLLQSLTQ